MANVNEAMKKFAAEQAARQASGEAPPASAWLAPSPAGRAAAMPRLIPVRWGHSLVVYYDRGGRIAEQYRALRNAICAQYREKRFCLLVTSALPQEGKTVTCLNLGLVLAEDRDRRTVVVDCNLRRSQVGALLRAPAGPGVADLLRGAAVLENVTLATAYPNLFVVLAGRAAGYEAVPLLRQPAFEQMVAELRKRFDYILLDSPAVSAGPDVALLGRAAGAALVVARLHRTSRQLVSKAIGLLHAANIKPAGIALTYHQ